MSTRTRPMRPILWIGVLSVAMAAIAVGQHLAGVTMPLVWRSIIGAVVVAVLIAIGIRSMKPPGKRRRAPGFGADQPGWPQDSSPMAC